MTSVCVITVIIFFPNWWIGCGSVTFPSTHEIVSKNSEFDNIRQLFGDTWRMLYPNNTIYFNGELQQLLQQHLQ